MATQGLAPWQKIAAAIGLIILVLIGVGVYFSHPQQVIGGGGLGNCSPAVHQSYGYSCTPKEATGPCTWFISLDGTTPVAEAMVQETISGTVYNPGDNYFGTVGQDVGIFLNAIIAANEGFCLAASTFTVSTTVLPLTGDSFYGSRQSILQAGGTVDPLINLQGGITDVGFTGFVLDGNLIVQTHVKLSDSNQRIYVQNMLFKNSKTVSAGAAILLQHSTDVLIQGNIFQSVFATAADIFGNFGANTRISFLDNIDRDSGISTGGGITIESGTNQQITINNFTCNNVPQCVNVSGSPKGIIVENNILNQTSDRAIIFNSVLNGIISGNQIWTNQKGIQTFSSKNVTITNNVITGQGPSVSIGIEINGVSNMTVINNVVNDFPTNAINIAGSNKLLMVRYNIMNGLPQENHGTATISASTTVVVNHGLTAQPTQVFVTPGTTGYGTYSVGTFTASQFTITVITSGTYTFYWEAVDWPAG